MPTPSLLPHLVPDGASAPAQQGSTPSNPFSLYDVALNGTGFMYAFTTDNPLMRETAPYEKTRIDQEQSPGEQTLTGWWLKSQESFNGGAGQLYLEPAAGESPITRVRYDLSKNVDVFTPGQVTRLADTSTLSTDSCVQLRSMIVTGSDAVIYLAAAPGSVKMLTGLTGTVTSTTFTGVTNVLAIATDGARVYAATATGIYSINPTAPTVATLMASYPASATSGPVIEWVKSRLMLGVNGAVYQVDVSLTGVTLGASQLLYQHPTPGWVWRCFSESPTAVLSAGDALGVSTISQYTINEVSGAPTLQYGGDIGAMPGGERILSLQNIEGTFLVIGTTRGVRVGQFDSFWSRLTYGPLELLPTDPIIPCNTIVARLGFAYAVGMAYDEGGLIALDLGTKTDQAGRYAWAPHLIAPAVTATAANAATVLPSSQSIVFNIPGTGILIEGTAPGLGREAWLRTSRIRFDTTEPKLFKLGRVRGVFPSAEIDVTGITISGTTPLAKIGFSTKDPLEFQLPAGTQEWLQLKLSLTSTALLRNYSVKALPGTPRQRHIKLVLAIFDNETSRTGQQFRGRLSARGRLAFLESLDQLGDEILFEEFTPSGVLSSRVVIEQLTFTQIGRPQRTSDLGGTATVLLRTVS